MVERGLLQPKGAARARVYVPTQTSSAKTPASPSKANGLFKDIPLSPESQILLEHVSQSLQARTPVGYNQSFLQSYEPNQTFYLTADQRAELLKVGTALDRLQPAGTYARHILNRLLIDLSWNSSRLEGNTYSLLETKRLIELGENAAGKNASEAQMILNHKEAIEYIIEAAAEPTISSHEVCSIHALLSENLLGDPSASGRIRQIAVGISGTTYMPLENPHVLKDLFQIFIEKLSLIKDPFEQSFFSLVHLSYLQAFEDVNKRTARIAANIPLIKKNLNPLSFVDVDQETYIKSLLGVYENNNINLFRDLYLWAYRRSCQRYSAIQQGMGEPNLLKLKYRTEIQDIIRGIILERVEGSEVVHKIQALMKAKQLPAADSAELFKLIETEISSLHEGNIARFKIRPSEFHNWRRRQ
ncbi:MAG: Fic family protein [Bdellovibrio sp.]